MNWKLGDAKQRLSEVVRASARAPQVIMNRTRPVAVLVGGEAMERVLRMPAPSATSLAEALDALTETCREESFSFQLEPRGDRPNAAGEEPKRVPRRHQRRQ